MASSKYVVAMAVSTEGVSVVAINKDEADYCERGLISGRDMESYHPDGFPKSLTCLIDDEGRMDGSPLLAILAGQPIFGNFLIVRYGKNGELEDMRISDLLWLLSVISGKEGDLIEAALHVLGLPTLDEFKAWLEEQEKEDKKNKNDVKK